MAYRITFAADDKVSPVSKKVRDNVSRDFDRMRVKSSSLSREFSILRNELLLGAFAITPILTTFTKMISESSKLEESINAVNVVFGEGAKQILDFGKIAVTNVGLATSEFNQLSAVTGALLRNVGFSEDEVAKQTIVLTKRAADLASVFNTNVKDALTAVNAAIRGETEPIRRYAGDITEATLKQHLLARGIDRSVQSLNEQEKRLVRLSALMEQTDVVHNDFINTQKSLANQWKIVNANISNASAELGDYVEKDANAFLLITNKILLAFLNEESAISKTVDALQDMGRTFIKYMPHLNLMWQLTSSLNEEFSPEVQENIRKYGQAMSGNFTAAVKESIDLVALLEGKTKDLKQRLKELAAESDLLREKRSMQPLNVENVLLQIQKERQKINMNTTATYGAQRDLIELMGTTQRETNESIRDIQGEINERMERQGLIAKRNWMNAQGFYQTEQQISDSARQAAMFTQQISNAFFTAAIHGQNLEQSVKSIVKSLAVRGLTAGITSLIPGVGFKDAFFGFQHGGEFRVGGSGGPDSQLVAFRASPNETVTVTPPGQTTNNRNITINIMAPELQSLDDAYTIETKIGPKIEDYLRQRGIA